MTERIYAVVHRTKKIAYVGRTSRPFEDRWREHLADAANPLYEKKLAEALRYEGDEFDFLECDEGEHASEREWEQRFRDEGYEMLNVAPTNKRAPRARRAGPEGWEEKKIYVPASQKGVALRALTVAEYEEMMALPTPEQRWSWLEANKKRATRSRAAQTAG